MNNKPEPNFKLSDMSKAAYLSLRGCRLVGTENLDNRTYFCFEDRGRCKAFLCEITNNVAVCFNDYLTAFNVIKQTLRAAKQADNERA